MSLFMVAPMAAWMRVRGCELRECGEMSAVMLLPTVGALVLGALALTDAQAWVSSSQHPLMLVCMIGYMLYRHEHYTRGYSLFTRIRRASLASQSSPPPAQLRTR
jgi:hypothetical protein